MPIIIIIVSFSVPFRLRGRVHAGILTDRKWVSLLTRGGHSVLPGGLVVAQGEQHGLDGADEDPSQAAVENDVEYYNFDCGGEKRKVSLKLHSETWKVKTAEINIE